MLVPRSSFGPSMRPPAIPRSQAVSLRCNWLDQRQRDGNSRAMSSLAILMMLAAPAPGGDAEARSVLESFHFKERTEKHELP